MSTTFSRSMRALQGDGFSRTGRVLVLAVVLLILWGAWFFFADVAIYEETDEARIEVSRASYPVESPVDGKVVAIHLALDSEVKAGDPLIELDAESERRQLEEEQSRLIGLNHRIEALRSEMSSRRKGQTENGRATLSAIEEARAEYNEAEAAARFAEEQARRVTALSEGGNVAELELQRAKSEAESRRAAAEARRTELQRIERQQQTDRTDRQVDIERLNHDIALLESDAATAQISIRRLGQEIERRTIRAQVSGRIGEVAELTAGSVIHDGEKLAAIVPSGELRVIASFQPSSVFGRIRTRQPASMRLAGFPWTQYGSIPATVSSVGSEVRDGHVRVELAIDTTARFAVPLQHGLPGMVEVEVERVSPAELVLRTAGRILRSGGSPLASSGENR
jgi:membrane fusion protein (multidrug efflux system)